VERIRKPAAAGMFYPGSAGALSNTIAQLFAEAEHRSLGGSPLALIVPHAGYPYSGRIAAKAYKLLDGLTYDTVVIVAPSHTVFFQGCSVFDGDAYETPLGPIPIDNEIRERLTDISPGIYISNKGHATGSSRGEHAIEVQLPFLQIVLGNFKLVPIVMGDQEESTVRGLGEALASVLRNRSALMVASTDLSHFHDEKTARRLDSVARETVAAFDPSRLIEQLEDGETEACGGGPTAAVMFAAKRLGASDIEILDYTTSGETTGDFDQVVGYLSAAITTKKKIMPQAEIGAPPARPSHSDRIDEEAQEKLHDIARQAIAAHFKGHRFTPAADELSEIKRGAFVTLEIGGQLRGCIGQIRARLPLSDTIAEMAVAAAFEDPRFPALSEVEFEHVDIEISVLSPLVRVHDIKEIEVGRDGLLIKLDMHSGLLLPQVATEYGWTTEEFLEQTCLKAGLPRKSYLDKFAEIYRFSAQVF